MGNIFTCCVNRQKNKEYPKLPVRLSSQYQQQEDYFFFNETDEEFDTIYDYGSIDL
tara:strand:+ start:349 stop:516 length:168 start_codon:yes stop_codon:yes gene_type:complete